MKKKLKTSQSIQLRFEQSTFNEIENRNKFDSLPHVIRRDLERYYYILQYALSGIQLTENEASLLCDVLNSTMMEISMIRLLWAEIEDAIRIDNVDKKWQVDGPAFVEKLKKMNIVEQAAIIDAVEKYWMNPQNLTGLIAVGLVKNNN